MSYFLTSEQEGGLFHPALGEYITYEGKKAAIMPYKKKGKNGNGIYNYEYLDNITKNDKIKDVNMFMLSPKYFLTYAFDIQDKKEAFQQFEKIVENKDFETIKFIAPFFISSLFKKDMSDEDMDKFIKIMQVLLKKALNLKQDYNYSEIHNILKKIDITNPIDLFNKIIEKAK